MSTPGPLPSGGRSRSRRRELGQNLALALASSLVFLGGAELVARLLEAPPPKQPAPAAYITDWEAWDGDFYTVKSTAVGWPPWEDYNTDGLRDREHTLQKRPGSWRVACLGDSVTMGWSIRPEQAWPQVLEEVAQASGLDAEVMNVALGGWSTRQELIAYRKIVRRYRPDEVLVGICLNDVAEMQNNLSRPPALLAALHRRSALVRLVVGGRSREIRAVEELFAAPDSEPVRRGYERMFADLRRLHAEVTADGARFGVLVFPFRFQVASAAPPPVAQATLAAFCRREGIAFLDLLPALAPLGETAFNDYDHLSPGGSRRVAEEVFASRLVPPEAASAGASSAPPLEVEASVRDLGPLRLALDDPDEGRRAAALRALAILGPRALPLVPTLTEVLGDQSPALRAAAAFALGEVGPPAAAALPRLGALLQDADARVRAGAAYALGRLGPEARRFVSPLVGCLGDADERVRWRAGDALGKIGLEREALPVLLPLVQGRGPGRGLAAEAVGRLGPGAAEAVPDLMAAARDDRAEVRWRAVWALGRIGPLAAPALPVVRAALADPDLRWRAAEALGGFGPAAAEAVPDLLPLLADPSSNVRWRTATALGSIRSGVAASALARAVHDPAENVRLAAVIALVDVPAPLSVAEPALLDALRDPDSRVRLHAVRGLGRLGSPSQGARRGLDSARRDPDPAVRAAAERVVRRHSL
jgi:HEAT repeat protein/lysophospholipase L1-like esterase